MNKLGVFYLIIMVLFTATPCSDDLEDFGFTQSAIVKVSHGVEKEQIEICSPICACICCGQSLVEIDISVMTVKSVVNPLAKQAANSHFLLLERNNNIWHPPKVV